MTDEEREVEKVVKNPYDNVYWFARMFVNVDKYAGIGRDSKLMLRMSEAIATTLPEKATKEDISVTKEAIFNLIRNARKTNSKDYSKMQMLCEDLDKTLETKLELLVLALTLRHVIVPTNRMLQEIPSSDAQFAQSIVEAYLKTKAERGVQDVINIWDDLGVKGCLAAERTQIVTGLGVLRKVLEILNNMHEEDKDYVISAFVQEFERRVGQKRKGRAGRSLEDVTGLILSYFGVTKAQLAPEHLRTSLEVDKLVSCKDGYYIGIACKRTFRERWKQQITTDVTLLDKYKVKELWHVITYDRDLSDDKIAEIGRFKGIIYLPDESPRYGSASQSTRLKNYVRPLSQFVNDLRKEVEVE